MYRLSEIIKKIISLFKRKRIVILYSAGAMKPWDGPLSSELDQLIIEDDKYHAKNGMKLGEYIFKLLNEVYSQPEKINFETFFSFLEEVHSYYYFYSRDPQRISPEKFPILYRW